MPRKPATLIVLALALALAGGGAHAHAVLLETTPSAGTVLDNAPETITLRFNEPVTPVSVRLISAAGTEAGAGSEATDTTVAIRPGGSLAPGTWFVSWRVVSADAHPVSGTFAFAVGQPSAHLASPATDRGSGWAVLVVANRAIMTAALLLLAGGIGFLAVVRRQNEAAWRHFRPGLATMAGVASVTLALGIGLQGALLADVPASAFFDPATWHLGASSTRGSAGMLALAGVALVIAGLYPPAGWPGRAIATAGAGCMMASFLLSGHTASAQPRWAVAPALLAHVGLAAFWLGSLLPLLSEMGRNEGERAGLVERFSRLAVVAVPVLVVAGAVLAAIHFGWTRPVLSGSYGMLLLAKVSIVAAMVVLAAINRYRLMPRLHMESGGAARHLRLTIGGELTLGLLVLAVTAALSQSVPPRAHVAGNMSVTHVVHDAPRIATASLRGFHATATLGTDDNGGDVLEFRFFGADGSPLRAAEATIRLSSPGAGIAPLTQTVPIGSGGAARLTGQALAMPGPWRIRAEVLISDFDRLAFEMDLPAR
ncbi:MAG: copper resistance protein CopC [Alphaproteobacteria bacterium]